MGKVSPISIKYTVYAKFAAEGPVEKPDVIGAIFGQTEGLLGDELELRELQKNGKIGRIEVELTVKDSKSEGRIIIPTSLDKTETTIIAAAIETIDRVGPCTAKVEIEKIDDVRGGKRDYVLQRARALLEKLSSESPDSREMQSSVSASARMGQITEYGEEKLPAGPDMENEELIVVEGRADVVNLLRYGFKNAIGMNGASLPKTITELGKTKTLTLFVDGDRGGILITKDALKNAKIAFVAQAPSGMEVEELTGKEINIGLRSKRTPEEFIRENRREFSDESGEGDGSEKRGRYGYSRERSGGYSRDGPRESREHGRRGRYSKRYDEGSERETQRGDDDYGNKEMVDESKVVTSSLSPEEESLKLKKFSDDISGTGAVCLLDQNIELIKKVSASEAPNALRRGKVYAIVYDGMATLPMLKYAERAGCKKFVAKNFSNVEDTKIELMSL